MTGLSLNSETEVANNEHSDWHKPVLPYDLIGHAHLMNDIGCRINQYRESRG